jgi:hypothetical protein
MEQRRYEEIARRVEALASREMQVETLGLVDQHPVHLVRLGKNAAAAGKVLLTGGVHGDEPAGVETVLRFLESGQAQQWQHFEFALIPCVNPGGYARNTRENHQGIDVNRSFEEEEVAEVRILKDLLRRHRWDCHVDFHEDWEARGFYMYEGRRQGPPLGPQIIRRVEQIGPIDPDDQEDEPLSPGVYQVSPSWGTKGLVSYVLQFHAPHVLIFETPTAWPMETRVAAHLAALDLVLAHYRKGAT